MNYERCCKSHKVDQNQIDDHIEIEFGVSDMFLFSGTLLSSIFPYTNE